MEEVMETRQIQNDTLTYTLCYSQEFAFQRFCELYVVITSLCLIAFDGFFIESLQSAFESIYTFDIRRVPQLNYALFEIVLPFVFF